MVTFGIIGYLMKKFEYPTAPLILAFILGPQFERYLRSIAHYGGWKPSHLFLPSHIGGPDQHRHHFLVSPLLLKKGKERVSGFQKKGADDLA